MTNVGKILREHDHAPLALVPAAKKPAMRRKPTSRKRRQLLAPIGLSKSMAKAMACETYFAGAYVQRDAIPQRESPLAQVGTEFHEWRKSYVEHLIAVVKPRDPDFAKTYLDTHNVSADARKLIERDAWRFEIPNPHSIYAPELFLSVDRYFYPLEQITNREPGNLSSDPNAYLSGQLDLVLIGGDVATIIDPKSGFSTSSITDDEPPLYAALVFAHFPQVKTVKFVWDFVRVRGRRRAEYTREDLNWIHDRVRALNDRKFAIIERWNSGKPLAANPESGLCVYCPLNCPLRPRADAGELALAPLQTNEDAVKMLRAIVVSEAFLAMARPMVRKYLNHYGSLPIGEDYVAALNVSESASYPIDHATQVLGLLLVDADKLQEEQPALYDWLAQHARPGAYTPRYDIPLSALTVGGLSGPAGTKSSKKRPDGGGVSREGLSQQLLAGASLRPTTKLVVERSDVEPELKELLEQSIDMIAGERE